MDRFQFPIGWQDSTKEERRADLEAGGLRAKLTTLALNWEIAALTLDSHRYKADTVAERESLRDSAMVYRKCITELAQILGEVSAKPTKPNR